jgi:hypothetical protein
MHPSLQPGFDAYLATKALFMKEFNSFAYEQLMFKPSEEEWSLLEVAGHLLKVEQLTLASVEIGLSKKNKLKKGGIGAWLRYKLVAMALAYKQKIKAPLEALMPHKSESLEELMQEWSAMSLTWKETLDSFPQELLEKGVFKHPLAGFFTIKRTLYFMRDHMQHHKGQIERLRGQYAAADKVSKN